MFNLFKRKNKLISNEEIKKDSRKKDKDNKGRTKNENNVYNFTEEEMLLETNLNNSNSAKHIIGPLFIFGGLYGIMKRIIYEFRFKEIRNIIPYKLKISYLLNNLSEEGIKYSNNAAGLGVVYYCTSKFMNYFLEERLNKISNVKRNAIYGFTAGFIFKSTRGLGPALLGGFIFSNCCIGFTLFANSQRNKNKETTKVYNKI